MRETVALICGGRDFDDGPWLFKKLDRLHAKYKFRLVVTGGAKGADTLADAWAESRGLDRVIYPANWKGHGKAGGYKRNRRMRDREKPDVVIAAPGGKGTEMMIGLAKEKGIKVIRLKL